MDEIDDVGGCPGEWNDSTEYEEGDQVAVVMTDEDSSTSSRQYCFSPTSAPTGPTVSPTRNVSVFVLQVHSTSCVEKGYRFFHHSYTSSFFTTTNITNSQPTSSPSKSPSTSPSKNPTGSPSKEVSVVDVVSSQLNEVINLLNGIQSQN